MSAPTEWPWLSLDKIFAEVEPVEPEPFDLGELLDVVNEGFMDPADAEQRIARHVNGLRCDIESARSKAVKLENENAEQTDRIAEALNWLAVAATFSTSEDCSAAIDDARAALEVKP